tara:strand:- start:92 stop:622 length:531 start_codon:yes stop_codon:yes gene_type:complete
MHNYFKNKYYFINKLDTKYLNKQNKNTVIIYRNYHSKKIDKKVILKIKSLCKKKGHKFFLSNDIKLAINLDLDGAYIPSFNNSLRHLNFSFKKKFELVGSAHNIKQIRNKELQKVSKIFLSSIFKLNENFLGINKFKLISKLTKKDVVVLGGITKKNIKLIKLVKCNEFAGISFFE